jgi:hypothetical protein
VVSNPINTAGTGAVQALAPLPFSEWGGGVLGNPPGSGAGQLSADGFVKDIRNFGPGPSVLAIPCGGGAYPVGISVRRNGSTDLAGAVLSLW